MSYQDLLLKEGINAQYLAVLSFARRVTGFSLVSGSIYKVSFTLGRVFECYVDGGALAEASSVSLSAGQFYYDETASELYIRTSDSANPSSKFVTAVYELYAGTVDAHWYRDPTDSSTSTVYFEPIIARVPTIKSGVSDLLFGTLPTTTTTISLNNAEKILNQHLYSGSINGREIRVYHWLGDLETANIKLVYRGRCSNLSWDDSTVEIAIRDSTNVFDLEFRPDQEKQFWSSSDYPNIDSKFDGKPIRHVYGVVDGFVPVNLDFADGENATSGTNRIWGVCSDSFNRFTKTATVAASPSSTTTRTYIDDATGFSIGDAVHINKATDEYRLIADINYSSNYIEHDTLSSGAANAGDTVSRYATARVDIFQNDQRFTAYPVRDYTESVSSGCILFTFSGSMESNVSLPEILNPSNTVICRVYGKENNVTMNGGPFGVSDPEYGSLTLLPVILYDLIKTYSGLGESKINLTSFSALVSDSDDRIGFAIPENSGDKFPKIKEVIAKLCQTGLVALYLDDNLKWAASRLKPLQAASGSIESDEILDRTISYDFSYDDLASDVTVTYKKQERSLSGGQGAGFSLAKAESETAKYLHGASNTLEVDSYHLVLSQAERLAERFAAIFGDAIGTLTIGTKNRFFGFDITEVLEVSRDSMPGESFESGTLRTKTFRIIGSDKGLRQVTLRLLDQKGIEDNPSSF